MAVVNYLAWKLKDSISPFSPTSVMVGFYSHEQAPAVDDITCKKLTATLTKFML